MASVTHKLTFKKYGHKYSGFNDDSEQTRRKIVEAEHKRINWCQCRNELFIKTTHGEWLPWYQVEPTMILPPRSRRVSQGALPVRGAS